MRRPWVNRLSRGWAECPLFRETKYVATCCKNWSVWLFRRHFHIHGAGQWKADQRRPEICTYARLFPYIPTRLLKLWGGPLLDTSLWLAATASDVCSSQIIVHWIIGCESRWHRKFSFLLWRYSGGHSVHVALHGADEEAQTSLYSSHTRSISVYKCDANSVRGNRSCNGSGPSSKTQSTYLCVVLLFETLQCTLLTHLSTLEVEEKQAERLASSKQERKTAS